MHCGARQRARSRDMSVYKIVGSMHSSVIYTQDCIRNKPSALSHSDVHLMTHDVQLSAMMCNCTNFTYKIKALDTNEGLGEPWVNAVRETLVCIKKTARRHKRGGCKRSDRNFRATRTSRKNKGTEKTRGSYIRRRLRQRSRTGR